MVRDHRPNLGGRFLRGRPPPDAPADAAHPGLRAAGGGSLPGRRGPRVRAPVDRTGGDSRGRLLAPAPKRPHHLHPPRPRALPGQGPRPPRDVRRAHGQGRGHQSRPRRLDAHRGPHPRDLRGQRNCGSRAAHRGGGGHGCATAGQRGRRRGLLRRRRGGPGRVPRSDESRRRVGTTGDLLLREQRLRGVLACVDPARGVTGTTGGRVRHPLRRRRRQRRRGHRRPHGRSGGRGAQRAGPGRCRGGDLPVARSLRGGSAALPHAGRSDGLGSS